MSRRRGSNAAARDAARSELLAALGGSERETPVDILGTLVGVAVGDVASHPECGVARKVFAFHEALDVLVRARSGQSLAGIAEQIFPGPLAPVPISLTAKIAKLPAYVVADLTGTTAEPNGHAGRTIRHAEHDRIVVAAVDPAWRKTVIAEARMRRDAMREAKRAERAAAETERVTRTAELTAVAKVLKLDRPRETINTTDAAKALGISTGSVRSAIDRGDLAGHQEVGNMGYGKQNFWRLNAVDVAALVGADSPPPWLVRARRSWERSSTRERVERGDTRSVMTTRSVSRHGGSQHSVRAGRSAGEHQSAEMKEAREAVLPSVPERRVEPDTVVFHVGPTNSGKTHDALDALVAAGSGTYAAPLRMLAAEAFERLQGRLGVGRVGLVTGEERIAEDAPILCCTAEMAPMRGDLLVLDEVHWADDPERGWAWTRLLLGAEYRHIRIAGAPDALPLVRSAFPDAEVVFHDRLCPLTISTKPVRLADIPKRSAVVAFSRKAVYHVAGLLKETGREPVVLYGAMPPGARRAEIARFIAGQANVVVATDVIGHGINLPVSAVLFAETTKFDGVSRR